MKLSHLPLQNSLRVHGQNIFIMFRDFASSKDNDLSEFEKEDLQKKIFFFENFEGSYKKL